MINLVITRGLKRLGYGRFLGAGRLRRRKGLPASTTVSGPLADDHDWSYPDGTPGTLNRAQSIRYLRDQEFGRTIVKYSKQFEAIAAMREKKALEAESNGDKKH